MFHLAPFIQLIAVPEYRNVLIPRLGDMRTSWNFLKVIGQHNMLTDYFQEVIILWSYIIWIKCDVDRKEHVGRYYTKAKGTRAHKITIQAMWQLLSYLQEHNDDLKRRLLSLAHLDTTAENAELVTTLTVETFREHMTSVVVMNRGRNPNFYLWWQYMQMVGVLLLFIRTHRDGNWELHLYSFGQMLPYFDRYDHTDNTRWAVTYLAQMNQLPVEVLNPKNIISTQ